MHRIYRHLRAGISKCSLVMTHGLVPASALFMRTDAGLNKRIIAKALIEAA
jgi:hypothetical protein